MKIGFSGTRQGMTNDQLLHVHMVLGDLRSAGAAQVTHGMCQGADHQFHEMAKALGYFTIGCPGVTADGEPYLRANIECDLTLPEKPYLVRNRYIVQESDLMIVTPKGKVEQYRGSGVWATIRYTRQAHKPLLICWPDGITQVERVDGVKTADEYRGQLFQRSQEV